MRTALDTFRSALFVPAHDEGMVAKALQSAADVVILDLEDAVLPEAKIAARSGAKARGDLLPGPMRFVRINGAETPWFEGDLDAIDEMRPAAVVLPKADARALDRLPDHGPPILALIETAAGLRDVHAIASHARVFALFLGGVDLGLELRLERRADGLELLFARSTLVVASAAAGLRPPMDVVHLDIRDKESLAEESALARSLGFGAKACIHPSQIDVVNSTFSPTRSDVDRALAVITAFERASRDGTGVILVDGRMVDRPVVRWAQRVLEQAEALGPSS